MGMIQIEVVNSYNQTISTYISDIRRIPDAEYRLTDRGSYYSPIRRIIHIGLPVNHNLTDDEMIEFTTGSITHEFIHHILGSLFNETISCLFDIMGDRLRRTELTRKVFSYYDGDIHVWADVLEEYGFKRLLEEYMLDKDKVDKILKEGC